MRYCIWIKCEAGQRLHETTWVKVYSWHIHSVYDSFELAEKAITEVAVTPATPEKCIKAENDYSLCGI